MTICNFTHCNKLIDSQIFTFRSWWKPDLNRFKKQSGYHWPDEINNSPLLSSG